MDSSKLYLFGFFIFIAVVMLLIYLFNRHNKIKTTNYLINSWPYGFDPIINYDNLNNFHNYQVKNSSKNTDYYFIDSQTASDLNLIDLFNKISISLTTIGDEVLYHILKTPLLNKEKLLKRDEIIQELSSNNKLRSEIQFNLYFLGKQTKGNLLSLINSKNTFNKTTFLIANILGTIFPIIAVACIFLGDKGIMIFFLSFVLCASLESYFSKTIEDIGNSTAYLSNMLVAAKKLSMLDAPILEKEISILKKSLIPINSFHKKLSFLMVANSNGDNLLAQALALLFFLRPKTYQYMLKLIENNHEDLMNIFEAIGTIDSYVSIASFKLRNKDELTTPDFTDKKQFLEFKNIKHPLVDNCTANSTVLNKKGIILTGSNMSGKSTFMRTIGVNILLAQTTNSVFAENYNGSIFRLITALDVSDDITSGESYYLAECKSILRILKNLNHEHSTFCMIDEIFKGTNPIERISASHEIIKYLMNYNTLAIIATHDLDLAKDANENYICHYFTEHVDPSKGLSFDFKLKDGICKSGNAIKLLQFTGYPEIITKKAIENLNNSININ